MGFGVKEAATTSGDHVPGTALIYDGNGDNVELAIQSNLKHARGKNSDIILVPQPSDSPNDPLVRNPFSPICKPIFLTPGCRIGRNGRRT
jgi:hypothetical protein